MHFMSLLRSADPAERTRTIDKSENRCYNISNQKLVCTCVYHTKKKPGAVNSRFFHFGLFPVGLLKAV